MLKVIRNASAVFVVLLAACTQASGGYPSIDSSATAQTKADAAFSAANTALALVYANNTTASPATGLVVTGTSTLAGSTRTFNETVTMTDYDPDETGIMATGDLVMKGSLIPGGVGEYTFTGDVFLSGAVASGHVLLDLSLKTTATLLNYTGTVTVGGTGYHYAGTQAIP